MLARLFAEHPAWVAAARYLAGNASSKVFFSHRPGEPWRLVRHDAGSRLLVGPATDPDLAFCFTPASIHRLAAVEGDLPDFAVALFDLMATPDERLRVGFRVIASFPRLVRRGYLRVLVAGGPRLLMYGAALGIRTPADVGRWVARSRASEPAPWEVA